MKKVITVILIIVIVGTGYILYKEDLIGVKDSKTKPDFVVVQSTFNPPISETRQVTPSTLNNPAALKVHTIQEFNEGIATGSTFSLFGNVSNYGGEYKFIEDTDSIMSATIEIPDDGANLTFEYSFINGGDGDFLEIGVKTTTDYILPLYIGPDTGMSRRGYLKSESMLSGYEGKTIQLIFRLVSQNQKNAILGIKNIRLITFAEYMDDLNRRMELEATAQ